MATGSCARDLENIAPRSYIVQSNGRSYRRTRVDIRDALEARSEHRNDHSVLPRPDVTPVPNVTVPIVITIKLDLDVSVKYN